MSGIVLVVGLVIGACIGVMVASLMWAARKGDETVGKSGSRKV